MTLREARRDRGLSQRELAAIVGIHPDTYRAVERGRRKPGTKMLLRLMTTLDVEPVEFEVKPNARGRRSTSRSGCATRRLTMQTSIPSRNTRPSGSSRSGRTSATSEGLRICPSRAAQYRDRLYLDPARVTRVQIHLGGLKITFHDAIYVAIGSSHI